MSTIRFELHINTESAAFGAEDEDESQAQVELHRILDEVGREVRLNGYELNGVRKIFDVNGNTCGYWIMTDEDPPLHQAVLNYKRAGRY